MNAVRFLTTYISLTALFLLTSAASCETPPQNGSGGACEISDTGVDPCMVGLTCDLSVGRCVKQTPCEGTLEKTCAEHIACIVDPNAFEGQVANKNFPAGCSKNCMAAPSLDQSTGGNRRCDYGYACDAQRLCSLGGACERGSNAACHGPNCGPDGTCIAPVTCATAADATCPNGLLCEELTHICFSSCATQSECRPGLRCDATKGVCVQ